jgi:hypothetical protein
MVGEINDTAIQTIISNISANCSVIRILSKNLVADEKWWAVSMTPLTNSGWSH